MKLTLICDQFPRLEYFFGCYLPRYRSVEPEQIVRRFALDKPGALGETVEQLRRLILYWKENPSPEDAALVFLENLDCPYYPPVHGQSALKWLEIVYQTLAKYLPQSTGETERAYASGQATFEERDDDDVLALPAPIETEQWPLHLVTAFLRGYAKLNAFMAVPDVGSILEEESVNLADLPAALIEPVGLTSSIEGLLEPVMD